MTDSTWSIVLGIVGLLVAIVALVISVIPVIASVKKKPRLSIKKEPEPNADDKEVPIPERSECKFLHVLVQNESLAHSGSKLDRCLYSWFGDRDITSECSALITFYNEDHSPKSVPMQGRWSDTESGNINELYATIGQLPHELPQKVLIPPGHKRLDIAVRNKGKEECYGWNDFGRAYRTRDFTNPRWMMGKGRYIVKVEVQAGGERQAHFVRLCNDGDYDSFRLEEIDDEEERKKLKKDCS